MLQRGVALLVILAFATSFFPFALCGWVRIPSDQESGEKRVGHRDTS